MDTVYFPEDANRSGIGVTFIRSRRTISIGGWYDTMVGIESSTLDLGEFLKRIGVRTVDLAAIQWEWSQE